MALTLSQSAAQAQAQAFINSLDAGGAGAKIKLYTQNDTLLATLTCAYPCGTASNGLLTLGAITGQNAVATGVAKKAVFETSAGVAVATGTVSSLTGSGDVKMNTVSIVSGGPVAVDPSSVQF